MTKKTKNPLDEFPASGLRPGLLGRKFRLEGDPDTYTVLGLKGRQNTVMLQATTSGKMLSLEADQFLRLATRIED
ncbi:MAG TPA: hypothetical protein VFS02_08110 [Telluria sp.]|nr:hypothetical protein [Telluria sp.]